MGNLRPFIFFLYSHLIRVNKHLFSFLEPVPSKTLSRHFRIESPVLLFLYCAVWIGWLQYCCKGKRVLTSGPYDNSPYLFGGALYDPKLTLPFEGRYVTLAAIVFLKTDSFVI